MGAMKRTFRKRVLPWWYWRRLDDRRKRLAGEDSGAVDGSLDFSDANQSALIALLEDI